MAEDVRYRISLEDRFSGPLSGARRGVSSFDGAVERTSQSTDRMQGSLGSFAKKLGLVAAGVAVAKKTLDGLRTSFNLGAQMEQTEIAFGTFLRSAEKGVKVIDELNEFANVTPFDNEEIIKSGRVLLAANIPAEQLTETLRSIGDVAAGANVPINELSNIYAKAMNKGKLQAEELNQLAERGIPIISQLSEEFGVTKQEVFELGSKGKITSDVLEKAFKNMTKDGGIFFNLMNKQSESASGLLSTLQGKMKLAATEMGKRMLPAVKNTTKGLIRFADKLIEITRIPVEKKIRDQQMEVYSLTARLRDLNIKEEERAAIITKLNEINPMLTDGLNAENFSVEQLNKNLLKYNRLQAKKIVLAGLEEKEAKLLNKEAENRADIEEALFGTSDKRLGRKGIGVIREQLAQGERFIAGVPVDKSLKIIDEFITAVSSQNTELAKSIMQNNQDVFASGTLIESQANIAIKRVDQINREAGKQVDLAKRIKRLQDELGIDEGVTPDGKPISAPQAVPSKELQEGISTIRSAAPKTFNINIAKFVENFEVNSQTIKEGASQTKDVFTDMWLKMIADVQAIGG